MPQSLLSRMTYSAGWFAVALFLYRRAFRFLDESPDVQVMPLALCLTCAAMMVVVAVTSLAPPRPNAPS